MNKKILITGAAGFIGFHLANRLLDKGYQVVGADSLNDYYAVSLKESRLSILRKKKNFAFVLGDLSDDQTAVGIFKNHAPDIVVHLAAQAGVRYSIEKPRAYIDSNITAFFNIIEACRNFGVEHFIYASSSSVYGNQKKTPFSVEDNVDKPICLYAATKKSNELFAHTYSHLFAIPSTGLRFFTVYGPYGRPDMAYFSFTKKIFDGEPIKIFNNGDLYRDFTYIDDIVSGIESMLFSPPKATNGGVPYKIYNIGNNKPEKLMHFIQVLEDTIGKKAIKEFLPMQAGDVYQTYADIDGLIADFDFKPTVKIEFGLGKFVEWYKSYYNL